MIKAENYTVKRLRDNTLADKVVIQLTEAYNDMKYLMEMIEGGETMMLLTNEVCEKVKKLKNKKTLLQLRIDTLSGLLLS